jgi:hypothetical protein
MSLLKLLILGGAWLFSFVLSALAKVTGRKKVQMLEGGKVCVHCHGTDVVASKAGVECRTCGQTTPWHIIKQPQLTESELEDVTERF